METIEIKKAQRIMARLSARAVAGRLGVTAFLYSGLALTVAGARADSGSAGPAVRSDRYIRR